MSTLVKWMGIVCEVDTAEEAVDLAHRIDVLRKAEAQRILRLQFVASMDGFDRARVLWWTRVLEAYRQLCRRCRQEQYRQFAVYTVL